MTIRFKLAAAMALAFITAVIVIIAVWTGMKHEKAMDGLDRLTDRIQNGAQAVQILATEYLLFNRANTVKQLTQQQKALLKNIGLLRLENPEWLLLKENMFRYNNRIDSLFQKLLDYRARKTASAPTSNIPFENRIASRLVVNALELGLTASRLNTEIHLNSSHARNRIYTIIMLVVLGAALVLAMALVWAGRGVTTPLKGLRNGIAKMGTGTKEERLLIKGKNEITQVAGEFNQMADRLRKTTVSRDELKGRMDEMKRMEKERVELEDQLRQARKMAGIGYWSYDPVTRMSTWTEEVYRIFGLDPDMGEVSYEELRKVIHPDDWQTFDDAVIRLLEEGESYDLFLRSVHRDGAVVDYNTRGFAAFGENGTVERLYGVCQDVTDRKRIEEALRNEKEKALRLLRLAGVMFIGIDADERIGLVNEKACEILESEEKDILGQNWFDHFVPERIREKVRRVFRQLMAENMDGTEYFENEVLTRTGRERIIAWHNAFIRDAAGNITGILGSGEDVTDRKDLEKQLIQSRKLEAVGTLAGGIAHDFNNILSIILGNTELAQDHIPEQNPAHENLAEIKTASLRARDVVRQLLSFSRKTDLHRKTVLMAPIVEESITLLRASVPATIDIQPRISKTSGAIKADPTQIHQVLINLCTNASHAMDEDGGILKIGLRRVDLSDHDIPGDRNLSPGPYVKLTVEDTGRGMAPAVLDKIFDPYFTTKEVGKGTGMGLAVVHGIVEGHGGTVWVESESGKGSTFTLLFPMVEPEKTKGPEKPEKIQPGHEHILFVDDEPSIVKLSRQQLERLEYKVTGQTDPQKALELFESDPHGFDLVITDMTMPRMTGEKLAGKIQAIRPEMPIILCTGHSEKKLRKTAPNMGISRYLEKPLESEMLSKAIREALD